jgi:ubiquitin carboxyl-terminal hydrolase 9/24
MQRVYFIGSSDSSPGGSPQHHYDGPNVELEQCLPGVIMSLQPTYCQFLLQLADKGCSLGHAPLRDAARAMLKLMPADVETIKKLKTVCQVTNL